MGLVVLWIETVEEIKPFYRNIENERDRVFLLLYIWAHSKGSSKS